MTHSEALVQALAARHGIEAKAVVEIAVAVLKDLHRVSVQGEQGPYGAIYESKWLLDEEGQYHLTGIVGEILQSEAPEAYTGLIEDVFRYISPERDHWNEELHRWIGE